MEKEQALERSRTVLVVDDDESILRLLRYSFRREGFRVVTSTEGLQALSMMDRFLPDLVILDVMLPGMSGLEVARRLRSNDRTRSVPILMLTARGEDFDVVMGLDLGADDYVVKPFSPRVLAARVKAILRRYDRGEDDEQETVHVGTLSIHLGRREVVVGGDVVDLTFTEFQVLLFLARRPGWVRTRSQIINAVRGEDYAVTERSVDVQIAGLRKKLDPFGHCIETVRGVGYRLRSR